MKNIYKYFVRLSCSTGTHRVGCGWTQKYFFYDTQSYLEVEDFVEKFN